MLERNSFFLAAAFAGQEYICWLVGGRNQLICVFTLLAGANTLKHRKDWKTEIWFQLIDLVVIVKIDQKCEIWSKL